MRKIIAVLVTALAVIIPLLAFAVPSQATALTAKASFDSIADQAATKMESLHPPVEPGYPLRDYEAWNSAYAAELVAYRDGTWNGTAQNYLQRVEESAVRNGSGQIIGYGMSKPYATWTSDVNSADTVYTVTMTDHVGEPLLAGFKAGAVPLARLQEIADALWNQPRYNTGSSNSAAAGKCVAYSNSPYDQPAHTNAKDKMWCAINVNIGVAAFLNKLLAVGVTPTGATTTDVTTLIQQIVDFTLWAEGQGAAGPNEWPYAFRSLDATVTASTGNNPQDANHAAYTAESLKSLVGFGTASTNGIDALNAQVNDGDHIPNTTADQFNNDYTGLINNKGFDIVGRLRAASAHSVPGQRHLLPEANWWVNAANAGSVEGSGNAYAWGQIGRWAARLATTATGDEELYREVEFMSKPRVYNYPYSGTGSATSLNSVVSGQRYTVWIDARYYDTANELQFLTNFPVNFKKSVGANTPALVGTKNTGYEWYGARFVWTVTEAAGKSVNICSEAVADQVTPYAPACRVVTVTN